MGRSRVCKVSPSLSIFCYTQRPCPTRDWIEGLFLNGSNISDAGLERLKDLTGLVQLSLVETNISDKGLEHLKGLTKLQNLSLDRTLVSEAGALRLKADLPKCNIWLDGKTVGGMN